MPPRKSREEKSAAPSPSPSAPAGRGTRSTRSRSSGNGKASSESEDVATAGIVESVEEESSTDAEEAEAEETNEDGEGEAETEIGGKDGSSSKLTLAERMAKLKDLRARMNQTTAQNRRDLISDHQKSKVTAKEIQRLEKQKKLAQTLRLKAEAEENGEDLERKKNWEWSIEDNERWEKKLEEQKVKEDTHFHNAEDAAHKLYNRNIRSTKADLIAYERQKEAALGLAPGTLVPVAGGSSSGAVASSSKAGTLSSAEDFYRGADTLAYGDSKPSEDAIDRVVGKINKDIGKTKRRKNDDDDGEVNYINDRNKVFNKKIARYFDKYTKEIRANFERGTAL
ncbi:hypothetical protein CI109_100784 [Kwoniella shandongensis]|uniref:Pre-mRNA-splicing factor SYF2 n=1 Tax=Kwoniella shandongensis TaxID=1734106 RepID=A0A5M6BUX0_9TREE|nr:uncharacterized protein CI109_005037 [Kwoniella shandongensis]KAA5526647.1 hypothetical protein CI109_005037 [Kwoniella shandongensis]